MDEKYQEYFSKQTVDKWSLMDYDNWLIKNFDHNQPVKNHRKFYSILTDILVNDDSSAKTTKAKFLLKNKKPSRNPFFSHNGYELKGRIYSIGSEEGTDFTNKFPSLTGHKDSKNANLLLKNPEILKIIHEAPEKRKKEEKKRKYKKKKNEDLDDKERALSLKERELDLKEREISLREREVKLRNES
ncbi:unnamed protein product [Rhizophagus irregularis]|nr:unnamed protein product [Rhizophagus irregularis]